MVWNFVIIGAVVLILIILIRKIPLAKQIYKKEHVEISEKEMTMFGLLAQADDAYERKDFVAAEELYVRAAASDPDNTKIYNRLGAIYMEQQNFYDAKESFMQSVKLDKDNASNHVNLGLAYMGLKDFFKAAKSFKDALNLDPKNKKYQKLLEKAEESETRETKK